MANRGRPPKNPRPEQDMAQTDHVTADEGDRTPRDQHDRATHTRVQEWKPPTLLPTPDPRPGLEFRWVRSSLLGNADTINVSAKFREGWQPVLASEYPELQVMPDLDSRFPDNIEIGGLILCAAPTELVEQRRRYQAQRAATQIDAVDRNFMRENDPRMPLLTPERQSRTSRFGNE